MSLFLCANITDFWSRLRLVRDSTSQFQQCCGDLNFYYLPSKEILEWKRERTKYLEGTEREREKNTLIFIFLISVPSGNRKQAKERHRVRKKERLCCSAKGAVEERVSMYLQGLEFSIIQEPFIICCWISATWKTRFPNNGKQITNILANGLVENTVLELYAQTDCMISDLGLTSFIVEYSIFHFYFLCIRCRIFVLNLFLDLDLNLNFMKYFKNINAESK